MQLGGTPPQLYDQARDGVVDIVWTLPGSTAGRFPSTEVFELPFIGARRGIVNAQASQEYADANLAKETADIKLLSFWSHDHGLIHANKAVNTMDDLKGLKLRSPNRLAGEALKALGATAVPMPIPQVPESIAQRAIDGAVVPWEVVPAIKLDELVKFHTEIPGSPTLYTASFFLAMNKAKYDGLPPDLKAAIDKNSGMTFARAGRQHVGRRRRSRARTGQEARQHAHHHFGRRKGQMGQGRRAGDDGLDQPGEGQELRRQQADRAGQGAGGQVR